MLETSNHLEKKNADQDLLTRTSYVNARVALLEIKKVYK